MSFTSASQRDLAIAISARSVSMLGDQAAVIALSLRLIDQGEPPWVISALLIAGLLPLVLLGPLAGRLIDAVDSRRLLVVAGLAQGLLCVGLVAFTSTAATLVLVAALGAGEAVTGSTWQALLPSIVAPDELPRALGLSQAAATIATILAPVVGGVLTGRFGAALPLAVDAGTFVLITVGAMLVQVRRTPVRDVLDERGGLALLRADPVLVVLVVLLGTFIVLGAMVNVVEVFLIRQTLHSSSTWFGVIGGLWGVGLFGGSLAAARARTETAQARLLVVTAVVLAAAVTGYAAAPGVGWLVPAALVGGVANGGLNLATTSLVMRRAPEAARGRIAAAITAIASAALVGAYLLGGALAALITPREIYLAAGLAGLVAPALCARRLMRAVQGAGSTSDSPASDPTSVPATAT